MARVHRMKRTDIHSCNFLKRFSTRGLLPVTILGVGCHLRTVLKTACDMHFEAVSLDGDHARFSFAIGICRTNDFTAKRFYRWSFPTQFLSISFHHYALSMMSFHFGITNIDHRLLVVSGCECCGIVSPFRSGCALHASVSRSKPVHSLHEIVLHIHFFVCILYGVDTDQTC